MNLAPRQNQSILIVLLSACALVLSALLATPNNPFTLVASVFVAFCVFVYSVYAVLWLGLLLFIHRGLMRPLISLGGIVNIFFLNILGQTALNYIAWLLGFVSNPPTQVFSRPAQTHNNAFLALYDTLLYTMLQLQGNSSPENQPLSEPARIVAAVQATWAVATFIGVFGVAIATICENRRRLPTAPENAPRGIRRI